MAAWFLALLITVPPLALGLFVVGIVVGSTRTTRKGETS